MKIVLASSSKFKSDILNLVHIKHSTMESNFKEENIKFNNVYEYVKQLAFGKSSSIQNKVNECIIIGLDTVVFVDGKILEKPKNINCAKEAIELCKNNITSVITGISIINKKDNIIINDYCETKVTLRDIEPIDIDYYLKNEENIMMASGFVIETIMSNFIEKIEGSYYNILGIPVDIIYKHINNMGYNLKDFEL